VGCTLLATGDLSPQRPFVRDGEPVWDALRGADAVFANLETALTTRDEATDKVVCLRADPALAAELGRGGIGTVTVANNHAMDFGGAGLADMLSALEDAGVAAVGAGDDLDAAFRPAVVEHDGLRIALLGMACTLPNGCGAGPRRRGITPVRVLSRFVVDPVSIDEDPGMAPFVETTLMPGDGERAADAVRAAAADSDAVVVAIHWGVPNGWVAQVQGELATYQRPLARMLVEAGADAIVGHHPHVLHGVEMIEGRPVFYSLGNFMFHTLLERQPDLGRPAPAYSWASLRGDVNHLGGLARLRWDEGGAPSSAALVPVWLDERGDPRLAGGAHAEAAMARVEELSQQFGTRWRRVDGALEVESV
jgi:poly-gamma-glutamate synthesis protein (capsule biosynthesis protein)